MDKFDALERGASGNEFSDELKQIHQVDQWMAEEVPFSPSDNFTPLVVHNALVAKRRKSRIRFFTILFGSSFLVLFGLIFLVLSSSSVDTSTYLSLPSFNDWFSNSYTLFSNPNVRQLMLVSEGILILVFIERLLSRQRLFRASAG